MASRSRGFFFDRDGILNLLVDNFRPPWHYDEISYFLFSKHLVDLVTRKGYIPIVVTNQPDYERGSVDIQSLFQIRDHICHDLGIQHYYACYHGFDNVCCCRKPKPGLLLKASKDLNIELSESFLIGDRWKDIIAGNAAGCKTILFNHSSDERRLAIDQRPDFRFESFNDLNQFLSQLKN